MSWILYTLYVFNSFDPKSSASQGSLWMPCFLGWAPQELPRMSFCPRPDQVHTEALPNVSMHPSAKRIAISQNLDCGMPWGDSVGTPSCELCSKRSTLDVQRPWVGRSLGDTLSVCWYVSSKVMWNNYLVFHPATNFIAVYDYGWL